MTSDPMDDEIEKAAKVLNAMSVSDVNMHLALNMLGLSSNVKDLAKTVGTLNTAMKSLEADVNGVQGIRIEVKDLRRDIRDTNTQVTNLNDTMREAKVVLWRIVWFLVVVGAIGVIGDIHAFAPRIFTEVLK